MIPWNLYPENPISLVMSSYILPFKRTQKIIHKQINHKHLFSAKWLAVYIIRIISIQNDSALTLRKNWIDDCVAKLIRWLTQWSSVVSLSIIWISLLSSLSPLPQPLSLSLSLSAPKPRASYWLARFNYFTLSHRLPDHWNTHIYPSHCLLCEPDMPPLLAFLGWGGDRLALSKRHQCGVTCYWWQGQRLQMLKFRAQNPRVR